MNCTQTLDNYLASLPDRSLSDEAIARLCTDIRHGLEAQAMDPAPPGVVERGKRAERDFVEGNLRLVVRFARGFERSGVPLDDLIQAGNLGLMKAAVRFDASRGFRFSTYAQYWIRESIRSAIAAARNVIRLPTEVDAELGRYRRGDPCGNPDRLHRLDAITRVAWIDDPRSNIDPAERGDTVGNVAIQRLCTTDIEAALGVLDSRSRLMLELRYGLNGHSPISVNDIAARFGLTRERIRQLHNQALEALRCHPDITALRSWIDH